MPKHLAIRMPVGCALIGWMRRYARSQRRAFRALTIGLFPFLCKRTVGEWEEGEALAVANEQIPNGAWPWVNAMFGPAESVDGGSMSRAYCCSAHAWGKAFPRPNQKKVVYTLLSRRRLLLIHCAYCPWVCHNLLASHLPADHRSGKA